jgi:uncharacterized repeat protein (TIGR02543 family)
MKEKMRIKLTFLTVIILIFLASCSGPLELEVLFETNGGSPINSMVFNEESTFVLPNDPVKEGYTFLGWFLDATFDTPFSAEGVIALAPEDTLTIYAQWTINEYTITFDSDGGSEVSAITQYYESIITAPKAPTKEGYTFNGWDQAIPETMPAESLALTATWTINQYTITFDSDGGSEVSAITQDYASIITAPKAPTKEGYTFNGWDQAIPETMPAESITLTATWTINQYTLSIFNEFTLSTTQDINFSQTLELTIIEVEGYRFKGWYIDEDFTTPLTFDSMPAYDLNVFAKYEKMLDNEWTIDIIKQSNNLISVNVSVQGIVNFSGFDNIFKYNSNTLKIVSIENKINAVINSNNLGEIYFNFIDATNVINEDIEVISIIFEITTVGDSNFELNVNDLIAVSENYNIIDVEHTVIFLDDR